MRTHDLLAGHPATRDVDPKSWVLAKAYMDWDSGLTRFYFSCPICGAWLELTVDAHGGVWPVLACFSSRGTDSGQTFGVSFEAQEKMVSV